MDREYDVIEAVRLESSVREKQRILKELASPTLMQAIKYAYNPYWRYYIKQFPPTIVGGRKHRLSSLTWGMLTALHTRKITGSAAKNAVQVYESSLMPKDAEVFKMIVLKDFKWGLGATRINEVFHGLIPQHKVMLAEEFDLTRVVFPCYISPKIDGVRGTLMDNKIYSRGGHEYVGLDHLIGILPTKYHFDGEIIIPDIHFQESSGRIRSSKRCPDAVFYVFDMTNTNVTFAERYEYLHKLRVFSNKVKIVNHIKVHNIEELDSIHRVFTDKGMEGSMIKTLNHLYQNKRSYDWMKIKKISTVDAHVSTVVLGEGKYDGMVGALTCIINGVTVNVGTGITDAQRAAWMRNPGEIIGKVIEISYMEKTLDGHYRHPVFKGIRHDK